MTSKTDKPSQEGAERRQSNRHALEIPIEISVGREMLIHATSNLSATGAFFERAIPYAEGTRARLKVYLPGEKPIECEGVVVNIPNKKSFGMGVKFEGLTSEDAERLAAFAAQHGAP